MTTKQTIGIVGGGQLGRYLTLAAQKLGFRVIVLDPTENSPAGQVADEQIVGNFTDGEKIKELGKKVDFLTFEIESANDEALEELVQGGLSVHPAPTTLAIIKDKYKQKEFLAKNGISVAPFLEVNSVEDAKKAGKKFGYPYVLKSRFGAYDGKGNRTVEKEEDIEKNFEDLGGKDLYAEQWIEFSKELAVVASRNEKGAIATYPVVETIHKDHICDIVIAPAAVSMEVRKEAEELAAKVMSILPGAGVFGIEMFLAKTGEVIVNEIAPRVHNSGHHTMDSCNISQFEQHIRAITGLPFEELTMKVPVAVMKNILGTRSGMASVIDEKAVSTEDVKIYIYGKLETRPKRKMGHINAIGQSHVEALTKANRAHAEIDI